MGPVRCSSLTRLVGWLAATALPDRMPRRRAAQPCRSRARSRDWRLLLALWWSHRAGVPPAFRSTLPSPNRHRSVGCPRRTCGSRDTRHSPSYRDRAWDGCHHALEPAPATRRHTHDGMAPLGPTGGLRRSRTGLTAAAWANSAAAPLERPSVIPMRGVAGGGAETVSEGSGSARNRNSSEWPLRTVRD